ncbi:unnamed protein product [Camellia sinensis]
MLHLKSVQTGGVPARRRRPAFQFSGVVQLVRIDEGQSSFVWILLRDFISLRLSQIAPNLSADQIWLLILKGKVLVIMGASGAGKSTIGEMLAKAINCSFLDADDFHPQSNKEKMQKGIPLSEEDRIPWLEVLQNSLRADLVSGKTVILGCSALQKRYREILRSADANYRLGSYLSQVNFVLLDARADVLAARLQKRASEGKHFMPATLLQSQLDLLQIDESEGILKVDATLSPLAIVNAIKALIFSTRVVQIQGWRCNLLNGFELHSLPKLLY